METRSERFDMALKSLKKQGSAIRSLRACARAVGMSPQHLSLWKLDGIGETRHDEKIAKTLGVSLDWLLNGGPNEEIIRHDKSVCQTTADLVRERTAALSAEVAELRQMMAKMLEKIDPPPRPAPKAIPLPAPALEPVANP